MLGEVVMTSPLRLIINGLVISGINGNALEHTKIF